ncbi:MAG: hypothetical protein JW745_02600 [Sedimentisphaerales bacterium]|nr:hypothetical protein [Sedimentisphaerales bacterium]MBN2842358.1 hypothetical protein [Sedimentisphaerales bacterium]
MVNYVCGYASLNDNSWIYVTDGGVVYQAVSYDNSIIYLHNGGAVVELTCAGNSTLQHQGGLISKLIVDGVSAGCDNRVIQTGGSITTLQLKILLEPFDSFSMSTEMARSDLSNYGIIVKNPNPGQILPPDLTTTSNSRISITGGKLGAIELKKTCAAQITGGEIELIHALYNSTAQISGGKVTSLCTEDDSRVTISARDFVLGSGLTLESDGKTLLGSGNLQCKWLKSDEVISINISRGGTTSTIILNELYCSIGDLNGDCLTNMADFAILASEWLKGKVR